MNQNRNAERIRRGFQKVRDQYTNVKKKEGGVVQENQDWFRNWTKKEWVTIRVGRRKKTEQFRMRIRSQIASWYFEPSQSQKIASQLKTKFSLSAIYSARKSPNHKLSKNHKISPDTNLHKTNHTQTSNTTFLKNQSLRYYARTRRHRRPFRRPINTRF